MRGASTYGWICLLFFVSCQEAAAPQVLESHKMIDILTEIRILEGSYSAVVGKPDTLKPYMSKYYQLIFDQYQVSPDFYYQSYDYYMAHPEQMEWIEDSVINRISDRLNRLQHP